MITKPYNLLRKKKSPKARAAAAKKTQELLAELPLQDLGDNGRFKYMNEDFGGLPVRLGHLTLYINFAGEYVEATNCLEMRAEKTIRELQLDAKSLEILGMWNQA